MNNNYYLDAAEIFKTVEKEEWDQLLKSSNKDHNIRYFTIQNTVKDIINKSLMQESKDIKRKRSLLDNHVEFSRFENLDLAFKKLRYDCKTNYVKEIVDGVEGAFVIKAVLNIDECKDIKQSVIEMHNEAAVEREAKFKTETAHGAKSRRDSQHHIPS